MAAPIFAHLHSSPLVVRRRHGSDWRSLSSHATSPLPSDSISISSSGLEPVDIIDVKQERKLLVQCLRESKKRIVWHSEVADLHTFRKVLSFGCRALHFSGHGVPGKVIFENKNCEAQFISQQELKDLLLAGGMERRQSNEDATPPPASTSTISPSMTPPKPPSRLRSMLFRRGSPATKPPDGIYGDGEDEDEDDIATTETERGWISLHPPPRVPVKLVFLSACHSESVAEAFVSAGVPHVVVVSKDDKVLDKKAMEFSKAFYTALFAGHSVARAFEIGQVQADISITSDAGNSKFKLLGHGDHVEPLFRDAVEGAFIENALPPAANECDAVAEVFVGRSLEVHQVYKSLVEGARLVSITGDRGVGKTEIALQTAQYAAERRVFKHIYFARVEESSVTSSHCSSDVLHCRAGSIIYQISQAFSSLATSELELANSVRQQCTDGSFLLILDGCNRQTRRDPHFRGLISLLLRRVSGLSILVTGDGKIGAMDGVGEKIIPVETLPAADAALLFTLRAPRRLKAHEMGGSSDLLAFADHPVIRSLAGHPRSICAVAQFLENKDLELDKHEFLNFIVPSVTAGLAGELQQSDSGFPIGAQPCAFEVHNHHHHHHGETQATGSTFSDHHLQFHHERWASMPTIPVVAASSIKGSKDVSSVMNALRLEPRRSDPGRAGSDSSLDDSGVTLRPRLEASQSEASLSAPSSPEVQEKTLSPAELCTLKIVESVKSSLLDEDGRRVWANAVVANNVPDGATYSSALLHRLESIQYVSIDWLAPQVSRYFATKLKADAAKRPLSVRSIDFLCKSTLVWGNHGRAPAQMNGSVDLDMFKHFWQWFAPLTECIAFSKLWGYTQPRLLHGFLSKGGCVTMLQSAPPGTFLIRFSETRQRCFVIVYVTDQQGVQFVPVACKQNEEGVEGWYVSLGEDSNGVTFATIQDLILSVTVLKFLFPQTPKEIAFAHD